eukprot:2582994-Amphidinium_carterae.1
MEGASGAEMEASQTHVLRQHKALGQGGSCQPEIGTAHFVRQIPVFGLRSLQHEGRKHVKIWFYKIL